jgi:hypothetical protein
MKMTKNLLMALFAPLERLINEHGSAVILRDQVALFRDQLIVADKKALGLESENTALKSKDLIHKAEIENFKVNTEQLIKEIGKQKQEIQRLNDIIHKKSHDNLLDKASVNILKLLFKQDNLTSEQIEQTLNITLQIAMFHLEELKVKGMVKQQTIYNEPPSTGNWFKRQGILAWALEQKGRKYLINNNLTS